MDITIFLTYFNEKRVPASTLKPMQYDNTVPFFPDDWTIGTHDSVLFIALVIAFVCSIYNIYRLGDERLVKPSQKILTVIIFVLSFVVVMSNPISRIGTPPTTYLVQTKETSPASGYYAFDSMKETAQTYEIAVTDDYQLTEDGGNEPRILTLSKADVTITPLFVYEDDATLGDYRAFKEKLQSALNDK